MAETNSIPTSNHKPVPTPAESDDKSVIVVDVGKKQRRKHIRQLRKGRGRLLTKIKSVLADLQAEGAMPENAHPVVFVVRERGRRVGRRFGF